MTSTQREAHKDIWRRSYPRAERIVDTWRARDVSEFVAAAHGIMRDVVACDFVSVLYRSTGDGFLSERDSRGRTHSAAFMRRYAELTPAAALAVANPEFGSFRREESCRGRNDSWLGWRSTGRSCGHKGGDTR